MCIVIRISMFIFSVIIGLDQGFQPMCGFCYGTKLYDRAKEGFWFSTKVGFTLLLFWAVVLMIFNQEVTLFRNDPEVIVIGTSALRYQMVLFPLCSFMMMTNMMMQTCRKATHAIFLAALRQSLFSIPLILVLPRFYIMFALQKHHV